MVMTRLLVMVAAAAAFVMTFVVMMVTAAAFVMLLVVMMMAAAAFVMLLVVMMVTAAAILTVFMVVMYRLPGRAGGSGISGVDFHTPLHSPGNADQLGNQSIRIRGGEPQLFRGKGDTGLLHGGVGIEFRLNLGSAVGAVQIVDDVYLPGHGIPSFIFIYEQLLMCLFQYNPMRPHCQEKTPKSSLFRTSSASVSPPGNPPV
jgi:hypothetical protein